MKRMMFAYENAFAASFRSEESGFVKHAPGKISKQFLSD